MCVFFFESYTGYQCFWPFIMCQGNILKLLLHLILNNPRQVVGYPVSKRASKIFVSWCSHAPTLYQGWSVWSIRLRRNENWSFLRLSYKRHCCFHFGFSLSPIICSVGSQLPCQRTALWKGRGPCRKEHKSLVNSHSE